MRIVGQSQSGFVLASVLDSNHKPRHKERVVSSSSLADGSDRSKDSILGTRTIEYDQVKGYTL